MLSADWIPGGICDHNMKMRNTSEEEADKNRKIYNGMMKTYFYPSFWGQDLRNETKRK